MLWDNHDLAIDWYVTFMGWEVKRKELWWPDQRIESGRMTHLGYGTWLNSVLTPLIHFWSPVFDFIFERSKLDAPHTFIKGNPPLNLSSKS